MNRNNHGSLVLLMFANVRQLRHTDTECAKGQPGILR